MLAAFVGPIGSGKTCLMTYFLLKEYVELHRRILANYELKFPLRPVIHSPIRPCCPEEGYLPESLDTNIFMDPKNPLLQSVTVGWDEMWIDLDSRFSVSDQNRIITTITNQSRKRRMNIYGTSQTFKQIDVRFRNEVQMVVRTKMKKDILFYEMFNRQTGNMTTHAVRAKPFWDLYDTHQIIERNILKKKKQEPEDSDEIPRFIAPIKPEMIGA